MTPKERIKQAKAFVKTYLEAYREEVSAQKSEKKPEFYENYPYNITVIHFPNDTLSVIFEPSDKGRIRGIEGDFDEMEESFLNSQRVLGFFPFDDLSPEAGMRMGAKDAIRDITLLSGGVEAALSRLDMLEEKINELVKLNPWLDEDGNFQNEQIRGIKEALNNLVVADDREYQLFRLRSFKPLPSEMKIEISGLEILNRLRDDISSANGGADTEAVEALTERVHDLEDRIARIGKLLPRIRDQINDVQDEVEGLKKGTSDDIEREIDSIREKMEAMQIEIDDLRKGEFEVPDQIKNTVFRMNRRVYNLGKRLETVEEYLKKMSEKKNSTTTVKKKKKP